MDRLHLQAGRLRQRTVTYHFQFVQGPQVAFGDIGALVALGFYARSVVAMCIDNTVCLKSHMLHMGAGSV